MHTDYRTSGFLWRRGRHMADGPQVRRYRVRLCRRDDDPQHRSNQARPGRFNRDVYCDGKLDENLNPVEGTIVKW